MNDLQMRILNAFMDDELISTYEIAGTVRETAIIVSPALEELNALAYVAGDGKGNWQITKSGVNEFNRQVARNS